MRIFAGKRNVMAAPYGNKNAEKWNFRQSIRLFNDAIDLTYKKEAVIVTDNKGKVTNTFDVYEFDFIGEIAGELKTFHEIFKHLTERFPVLKRKYNILKNNIERNCYSNTKKGYIKEATGIVNLKSNYKWTDRLDNTSDGEKITNESFMLMPDGTKLKV